MIDVLGARLRAGLIPLATAALLAIPRLAEACSVCTAGRDEETQAAFIGTTVFLSALPLAMIGGAIWWLRRRVRSHEGMRERELAADSTRLTILEPRA